MCDSDKTESHFPSQNLPSTPVLSSHVSMDEIPGMGSIVAPGPPSTGIWNVIVVEGIVATASASGYFTKIPARIDSPGTAERDKGRDSSKRFSVDSPEIIFHSQQGERRFLFREANYTVIGVVA